MTIFEKALAAGLEQHHIDRAQLPFDGNAGRTVDIHESMDRVIVHAAWYDANGKSVSLGHIGITVTEDGATLWRRVPPAVLPEIRRKWDLADRSVKL